jgi:hypothetical protein
MKQKDVEQRVRQISWPAPPPSLRARVLSAPVGGAQPITWSDRVWYSRGWRWSAVGAALVCVLLDRFSGSPRAADLAPPPRAMAEAQAVDEMGRQVGLPPDVATSLARRALAEASAPQTPSQPGSTVLQAFELEGAGR